MKISTKGRYSLRMLLDLAEHKNDGFISLKDISQRQGISKKYLEQIVTLLSRPDILRTNRGNKGGYMLAKEPDQYTVGQILRITEGGLFPVTCLAEESNKCERREYCKTVWVWQGLEKMINEYLDGISLQDVLHNYRDTGADEYYI
ncbi:MAG: Rrf2 family transcriptional regulator [Treponema sp.]|nr:Rrf2 family transcriptional regulator [Treponema sp.]